jgi:pimeloyl-ACP methyl ester carboxylesterase
MDKPLILTVFSTGCRALACALLLAGAACAHSAEVVSDFNHDARFAGAVAKASMENPADFKYGGVYLQQSVQPDKEVVLFVHGANGSPRDWGEVASHLSTNQQAWFAYYASGDAVAKSSSALVEQVLDLMRQHGLTRIRVMSHSFGGLVAWYIVHDLEKAPDVHVQQFVTVSTPWNGNHWARLGTLFAIRPADSWRDLAPESPTLKYIWNTPLRTPYTLVSTVMKDEGAASDDGTISLDSQLVPWMELEAEAIVTRIASHVGVLHGDSAAQIAGLVSGS